MAITHFIPEVWSATLLSVLERSLVYAGAPCVNRNYEGDIAAYGDTVHIVSIADPTIVDYAKDTDLTVEVLTDSDQQLVIDQAKAFAFEIDDIAERERADAPHTPGRGFLRLRGLDGNVGGRHRCLARRRARAAQPDRARNVVDATHGAKLGRMWPGVR